MVGSKENVGSFAGGFVQCTLTHPPNHSVSERMCVCVSNMYILLLDICNIS